MLESRKEASREREKAREVKYELPFLYERTFWLWWFVIVNMAHVDVDGSQ